MEIYNGKINVDHDVAGIEGLCVIEPKIYEDSRGYLLESYNKQKFDDEGLDFNFVQDNQVHSHKGVLRGCHVNKNHPQGKLVRVINGAIFDVVIDLRRKSKTYRRLFGIELSATNLKQLYIPEGMGHGYLALSEAEVLFKVTRYFVPGEEVGFAWNSKELKLTWPDLEMEYLLSEKDSSYPDLLDIDL